MGKSQLSKYENGKELPRLDSLEKLLTELGVSGFAFFYILQLIDRGELVLVGQAAPEPLPGVGLVEGVLPAEADEAMERAFTSLLGLYKTVLLKQLTGSGGGGAVPGR